jgi:mannose/fructose-specific phosphotransferase system component IIA
MFNKIPGIDIYNQFQHVFKSPQNYLVLVLVGFGLAMLDEALQMTKRMLQHFADLEHEKAEKKRQKLSKLDPAVKQE